MDQQRIDLPQQNNPQNQQSQIDPNNSNLNEDQFKFRMPTKNPQQVFQKLSSGNSHVYNQNKKQVNNQIDNNDDNKSQTSQKSGKSGSSVGQKKRKGSFLEKLSEKQEQQEQKLQQMRINDAKSIFLQNVDYKATKQQLQLLFEDCGKISRITILKAPFTNQPKGCAYISFETEQGVERALYLSGITLRNRTIKVHRKRTNLPGLNKGKKQDITKNFLGIMQNYTINAMRGRGRGRGR